MFYILNSNFYGVILKMSKKNDKKKKRAAEQKRNIEKKKIEKVVEAEETKIQPTKEKTVKKSHKKENVKEKAGKRTAQKSQKSEKVKNEKVKETKTKTQKPKRELNKKEEKKVEKHKKDKEKKKNVPSKKKKIIIGIILAIFIVLLAILIYMLVRPKFKDFTIELGTKEIKIQNFLVSPIYEKGVSQVTKLKDIDISKVGETKVTLKFWNKEETVKLKVVDTTAPKVKFKEHTAYIDYKLNPDDFIESKEDLSEMTVSFEKEPVITDYGDYPLQVIVSDKYGNKTIGKTKLIITWLYNDVKVELGSEFSVANVVVDAERFGKYVSQEELNKVDVNKLRNLRNTRNR